MQIRPVVEVLGAEGLAAPVINVLVPNETNYSALLMQPCGQIEASSLGVRNRDRDLARRQFGQFLGDARKSESDLVITPEYSVPWDVLESVIREGRGPGQGKLWALGCESIKYSELQTMKERLAEFATVLFEPLEADAVRFVDPLAYVFNAPAGGNGGAPRTVVLVQFKTYPMGDKDHFEINGLQRGARIYRFGVAGQSLNLVSLICSDIFAFDDATARDVYDRALIIHIQLNQKPRQDLFRLYRDLLFLQFKGDETELICLNWAKDVCEWNGKTEKHWNNIAASAWYLRPKEFDERDATLRANHRRGLYYTWMKPHHTHALFFNYRPAIYRLVATKVAHIGVSAPVSRRVGPKLVKTSIWDEGAGAWVEQAYADDEFSGVVSEAGDAANQVQAVYDNNPINGERVLALCAGNIENGDDWHSVRRLDSCAIDQSEVLMRMTFCQDTDPKACEFRVKRLRRCRRLWDILNAPGHLPPALADFKDGFRLAWSLDFPHQNAATNKGGRATVVYMGEECNDIQVEKVAKTIAELLRRRFDDPQERRSAMQRLAVCFRDKDKVIFWDAHRYVKLDQSGDASEFYIGRES